MNPESIKVLTMKCYTKFEDIGLCESILSGGIGILPTDTLYGFSCRANDREAIDNIYKLKKRDNSKPFIILISNILDLRNYFSIFLVDKALDILRKIWPNTVSVILPCKDSNLEYLHRGSNSLAFRIPLLPPLVQLLTKTGPLISTTVNTSGETPLSSFEEMHNTYGKYLDFGLDIGSLNSTPSTVIKLDPILGQIDIVREGGISKEKLLEIVSTKGID